MYKFYFFFFFFDLSFDFFYIFFLFLFLFLFFFLFITGSFFTDSQTLREAGITNNSVITLTPPGEYPKLPPGTMNLYV
jgi:hypothetical protein